jgi:hypothetical protein
VILDQGTVQTTLIQNRQQKIRANITSKTINLTQSIQPAKIGVSVTEKGLRAKLSAISVIGTVDQGSIKSNIHKVQHSQPVNTKGHRTSNCYKP